ncbi:hypothetical protein [Saezia sanguinis]|uniref:hypothetical protein n=1 Tax=Saezia sanguinis TaxID=1965230 RepID=UPI0030D99B38
MMKELCARPADVAKAMRASVDTVRRWLKDGSEPWFVRVAFFLFTIHRRSTIDADAINRINDLVNRMMAQKEYIRELERRLSALDGCEVPGVDRDYLLPHPSEFSAITGSEQLTDRARF